MTKHKKRLLKGKELIQASFIYANEDRNKSWYYTISTLLMIIAGFAGCVFSFNWSLQLLFGVVTGLLLVRFFIIYHDYQHESILQNSLLAKMIMTVYGILILAPPNIWKRSHDHHHNHNSRLSNEGIGSYPLLERMDYLKLTRKQKLLYLASRHPLTIFGGYITLFVLDFNVKSLILSPRKHVDSLIALIVHFAICSAVFYFGGFLNLILAWLLPVVISNGLGAYLFYAQHNFPGAVYVQNKDWNYTAAASRSTSFLKMGKIMNWFTGNIGYHHVHHLNHRIPFYRLKEAMKGIPEMQSPKVTTLKPKDVMACLKLKVWDANLGKMTGL